METSQLRFQSLPFKFKYFNLINMQMFLTDLNDARGFTSAGCSQLNFNAAIFITVQECDADHLLDCWLSFERQSKF